MDRSCLIRKTVDADPRAQLAAQVFVDPSGRVWHDFDYVYAALQRNGLKRGKAQWREDVRRVLLREGVPDTSFLLRTASESRFLQSNMCTTFALFVIAWGVAAYGKSPNAVLQQFLQCMFLAVVLRIQEFCVADPCATVGPCIFFPHLRASGKQRTRC